MLRMIVRVGNFLFRYRNGLFPFAYAALFVRSPRLLASPVLAGVAGFLVAGCGQLLRAVTIGSDHIPRGGKGGQVHAKRLVQNGIYAHCRNPLYLGNLLILLGLGLASNSVLFLAVVFPVFLVAFWALLAAEESYLRSRFGDEFACYCARVPRLIPSLSGLGSSLVAAPFRWRRFVSAEQGPTYIWLAAMVLVWLKNLWMAGEYRWDNPQVRTLWTLFAVVTLAYALARFLKKTGRLQEPAAT